MSKRIDRQKDILIFNRKNKLTSPPSRGKMKDKSASSDIEKIC